MKKIIIPLLLLALIAAGYVYYTSKQVPDVPVATLPTTGDIQTGDSQIATSDVSGQFDIVSGTYLGWKATKPTGFHTGKVLFTEGSVEIVDGIIDSGFFVLDMTSITLDDSPDNTRLLNEIKEDIFSASNYPTSEFTITSVVASGSEFSVQGNLTIAGQTHPIIFPAQIVTTDEETTFKAAFAIDRRVWGLTAFEGIANDYIEYIVDITFAQNIDTTTISTGTTVTGN